MDKGMFKIILNTSSSTSKTFDKNSNVPMQIDMMYLPMHDMMLYKRFHLFFRNWGMSVRTWNCARLQNYLEWRL